MFSCEDGMDDIYVDETITKFSVDSLGSWGEAEDSFSFCEEGVFNQILEGSSQSNSSIYTIELGARLNFGDRFSGISIFIIGDTDQLSQESNYLSSQYNNIYELQNGNDAIIAYPKLVTVYEGRMYKSIYFDSFSRSIDKIDENAITSIEFKTDTTLLCQYSDNLIIESKITYSGYLYSEYDYSDSIRVSNLEVNIFNNSL